MGVRPLMIPPALAPLLAWLLVAASARPGWAAPLAPQDEPHDTAAVVRLLERATYGPRPEDISRAEEIGIEGWLDEQLHPERIEDPVRDLVARRFPAAEQDIDALLEHFPPPDPQNRPPDPDSLSPAERQRLRRERAERSPARILGELTGARLLRAARSERQLEEVMTAFWMDHFNVFFQKGAVRWMVSDYEQSAIRAHVFGRFEDMLVATARHPAMLFYLDNWRSAAVDTARILAALPPARRAEMMQSERLARLPGLNENYARELLELHTLGVDGGYDQNDVTEVARVFTGWTLTPPRREGRGEPPEARMRVGRRPGAAAGRLGGRGRGFGPAAAPAGPYHFWFRQEFHDQGSKTVLGRSFSGRGEDEGLELLRMLAHHPSTARHIARQLATRFVSDDPPPGLVDRLAEVFLETDGDLREVTRALFTAPELYDRASAPERLKSPFDLVASTLRLTRADVVGPAGLLEVLRSMGEAPYLADAPTGYPESSEAWTSTGGMLDRVDFATRFAAGEVRGVVPDGAALRRDARAADDDPLAGLVRVLVPGADPDEIVEEVREAAEADPGSSPPGPRAVLGLVLASPAFQRH